MTSPKQVRLSAISQTMLDELAKANRKKPDIYLEELIREEYKKKMW